jgi:IS4 transposase
MPVDYRIYNPPEDGKTKNDQFQEMLKNAKEREVTPEAVVADSWYSSLNNMKCIRDLDWVFVLGLRKNRVVNRGEHIGDLTIPEEGLKVHLRGYGWIYVFRFDAKNGRTDYIATNMNNPTREKVERIVKERWSIEVYHRELKQTCGLECCQSRNGRAQRNHIGFSVLSWIRKNKSRNLASLYQQKWDV